MPRKAEPFRVRVIRYQLPNGKNCRKTHPKARRVEAESSTYYAYINGKREPLGTKILSAAWAELGRRQRGETSGKDAGRDLADLLPEYRQHLLDAGSGPAWVTTVGQRLARLFSLAGWHLARDLDADGFLRALAGLQRLGRSHQTRNHYLIHGRAFSAWLGRRTGRDVLRGVGRLLSVEADPRHPRRCPSDEEVGTLFAFLDRAGRRHRMTARQRSLGYQVCMATGFRLAELRSLTRESFDLETGLVCVQAAYSKHRRLDTQPLPAWLVGDLRAYFGAGGQTWECWHRSHGGDVLRDDLDGAGIPYQTGEGYFDMHSLRVYYISQLANQPGISVKTLMELARHSSPSLTLKTYAKARRHDLRAAVDEIPRPVPAKPARGRKKCC